MPLNHWDITTEQAEFSSDTEHIKSSCLTPNTAKK